MQVKKLSSRSVKEELARVAVKLYNEGLGCYQIAKVISFEVGRHYSADQIRKMLKKAGLKMRPAPNEKKIPFSLKDDVAKIAIENGTKAALQYMEEQGYSITKTTLIRWVHAKQGICRIPPELEKITREAAKIYEKEKIGAYRLSRKILENYCININPRQLINYIKKYTKVRTNKESLHLAAKHELKSFNGTTEEKYYMVGFRLGDLYIRTISDYRIMASVSSSRPAMEEIIEEVFSRYGPIDKHVYKHNKYDIYEISYRVILHRPSFDFLIPFRFPEEKLSDKDFYAFTSGIIDAEGCISLAKTSIEKDHVNVTIDISNKNLELLTRIKEELISRGIMSFIRKSKTLRGDPFYRLVVREKQSALKLLRSLSLKHKEKRLKQKLAIKVVEERLKWSQVRQKVEEIRKEIEVEYNKFQKKLEEIWISRCLTRSLL
ncbi:MAG: LAGLIDADG family homing endonuclease [Aigarchaeota archaeon]|nr:LAGLIDADG family homing endonuclease [Candidatus Geocrenenecus dongiae]